MPRGRPRGSPNVIDRWDDTKFQVAIYARTDKPGFRIVSGFRGARAVERSATTAEEARAIAEVIWRGYQRGDIEAPDPEPMTLQALGEAFAAQAKSKNTRRSYLGTWTLFARHVGVTRHPKTVYRMDVLDFFEAVETCTYSPKKTSSPQTILSYHRTLRAGFRWAIRNGWLVDDPTDEIELDATHQLGPWLPYEEWEPFLTQCGPMHQIRAGFVLETGLRESEIAFARWSWLRGEVGRPAIYVGPDSLTGWRPKRGSRVVPLSDVAQEWLRRAKVMWPTAEPGTDWIFSQHGLSAMSNLARETRHAVAAAGVTKTTFHGLRRSAGAHWLDCGVNIFETSRLLGHAEISTTQKWYADLSDSTLLAAITKVEQVRARDAERAHDSVVVALGSRHYRT